MLSHAAQSRLNASHRVGQYLGPNSLRNFGRSESSFQISAQEKTDTLKSPLRRCSSVSSRARSWAFASLGPVVARMNSDRGGLNFRAFRTSASSSFTVTLRHSRSSFCLH